MIERAVLAVMCGPSDPSQPNAPLIVVLDPDEAVREAVSFSLETEGYRVSAFAGAEGLLDCAQCLGAACFVIDEAVGDARLEQLLRWRRAPVMLLSNRARPKGSWPCLSVVEKPLVTDALSRRIAEALRAS